MDRDARQQREFEALVKDATPALRRVLRRIVGQKEDIEDLAQDTLIQAWGEMESLPNDEAFSAWLCSIGTRLAVAHLRTKKRWRERAQVIFAQRALAEAPVGDRVGEALQSPEYAYDVREHIAYCFVCIGRTLEPEKQAALVLRDVQGASNDDAAKSLGLSPSVLREHVGDARKQMQTTYQGLCALVNEEGVCNQCQGLRDVSPPDRRGMEVPEKLTWEDRLEVVRKADLDGLSRPMHDVFFRQTDIQEENRFGNEDTESDGGVPT